jgi:hypothetical protein
MGPVGEQKTILPVTQVKVLRGITIFCQKSGCGQAANHLLRSGISPVFAYREPQSEAEANSLGIELPLDATQVLLNARWWSIRL